MPWRSLVATTRRSVTRGRSIRPPRSSQRSRRNTGSRSMLPPRRSIAAGCFRTRRKLPRHRDLARGHSGLHGSRLHSTPTLFLRKDRGSLRCFGVGPRRPCSPGRGPGTSRPIRPTLVRSGGPSFERRAVVGTFRYAAVQILSFQRSLVTAREQGARLWELRGRLQSCPALARPGQTARGTRSPLADLSGGSARASTRSI